MFLRTVMCGQSAYDWKTIPMLRLFGGTLTPFDASKTCRSPKEIAPSSAVSRPAMQRRVVVLPQPLGPSRTRNSPGSISRSRLSIAVVGFFPPKYFDRPRMLTLDKQPSPPGAGRESRWRGNAPPPWPANLLEQALPVLLEVGDLLRRQFAELL